MNLLSRMLGRDSVSVTQSINHDQEPETLELQALASALRRMSISPELAYQFRATSPAIAMLIEQLPTLIPTLIRSAPDGQRSPEYFFDMIDRFHAAYDEELSALLRDDGTIVE
jgi:hypothetical protein